VPPPLPQAERRQRAATFSTARRSQPPPRKRRAESVRPRAEQRSAPRECDPAQFSARCVAFEPKMSELAVCNDVLRASLPVAAPPSLSVRLEQRLSAWFPSFERALIHALYWFSERSAWQRGALSMAAGATIGLSLVLAGAGLLGGQRGTPAPTAVAAGAASAPPIAPAPPTTAPSAPAAAPLPAVTASAAPEPLAADPIGEQPESKPARKHAKKRAHRHRRAASKNSAWTFPHPGRRSP
jgi:hypothetical protein